MGFNELETNISQVVEAGILALNDLEMVIVPFLTMDSGKLILNDHIPAFDNVHLVSLFSPNIVHSEAVCINNNADSPFLIPLMPIL